MIIVSIHQGEVGRLVDSAGATGRVKPSSIAGMREDIELNTHCRCDAGFVAAGCGLGLQARSHDDR